jgi:anti-sigma factor RsiW
MTINDELLTSYLDGESSPDARKSVDLALTRDPQLRKRLENLKLDRTGLKSAFDTLLDTSPPRSDVFKATKPPAKSLQVPLKVAGLAVLCGLAGWGLATWLPAQSRSTWQQQAAIYHSLYVNSTVAGVNNSEAVMQEELERVSVALGKSIELKSLRAVEALSYKRSQILGFEGQPLMQIAYLSALGSPVVLCIMRRDHDDQKAVETTNLEGMVAATWSAGRFEYMLIGGNDSALIEDAAKRLSVLL